MNDKGIKQNKATGKKAFHKTFKEILNLLLHQKSSRSVYEALSLVKAFFDADRVFIGYFDEEKSLLSFIYEVCTENVYGLSNVLNEDFKNKVFIEGSIYDWWIDNLKNERDTVINNVNEISDEFQPLVDVMIGNGVKSVITTPIYGDNKVTGFLGIEYVKSFYTWKDLDLENVHILAELFSIVIEKELAQKFVKQSLRETLRSNTIFQRIFEILPVGIELYDENGTLTKVNPYDLEILETTEEAVLGVNLFENPLIPQHILEEVKNGEEVTFENDYDYNIIAKTNYCTAEHKNKVKRLLGKCIPLKEKSGKVFGYLMLVHQDVSYYQKKEELAVRLAKLELAVDTGNSFLWSYNVVEDKIIVDYELLKTNKSSWLKSMKNFQTKEAHLKYVYEEDIPILLDGINRMLAGEIRFFTAKYRQYLEHNELCWLTTNFSVYEIDGLGKPQKLICLTTNITQQQQNEIALFKAKEANEIKNAFIENISHELRTPLNIIVGFSHLLAESNTSEESQYFIDLIHENNQHLLNLVDNILNFAQIEKGRMQYKLENVDIKDICREAFARKLRNKKPDNNFVFDENNLPSYWVKTDKERLVQVLYLLLDNANKYTDNGMVTLSYHLETPKEVRIEVKDSGVGLTQEDINNISLQFYKVNSFNKGLGLGLPISREIVKDMGGVCGVDSKKGVGSNFWFTLPLADSL